MADQISDAILDAILAQDKFARVACETMVTTGLAMIAGEITTTARIDYPDIVRQTIKEIGYNDSSMGFDWETCAVLTSVDRQSPDIAQGVEGRGLSPEQGAGDQGLMFGYASTSTENFMPMPIWYAHRLAERLAKVRKDGTLPWLRPDGKTQVTVRYENGVAQEHPYRGHRRPAQPRRQVRRPGRGHHRGSDQEDHPRRISWWTPSSWSTPPAASW